MLFTKQHRTIIVGAIVLVAVITLLMIYNNSKNNGEYCVQFLQPIEPGEISSQSSEIRCFTNLAEQASFITDGELQLNPNVSEADYNAAIMDYYAERK